MRTTRKLTSLLLTLSLILAFALITALPAWAETVGNSWDARVEATQNETIEGGVNLTGDTDLLIRAGVTLTVNNGINTNGRSLTIKGPGTLKVIGTSIDDGGSPGINGDITVDGGTVEVYGGNSMESGSKGGCGIDGDLTLNGGDVLIVGGDGVFGIADCGVSGTMTLNGGVVTVRGGYSQFSYSYDNVGVQGDVILNGGAMTVTGGENGSFFQYAAAFGSSVKILAGNTYDIGTDETYGGDTDTLLDYNQRTAIAGKFFAIHWDSANGLPSKSGGYRLWNDVRLSNYWTIESGKNITLDLNGRVIDRGLKSPEDYGYVIDIQGSLTLMDSSPLEMHTGVYAQLPRGGVITGGNSNFNCCGVYVAAKGTFTMESGTIFGNESTGSNCGGVYILGGATMNGGVISGNIGRGVVISYHSLFMMNGGTVSGNRGGGVYCNPGGCSFTVSNRASVTHNTAEDGITQRNVILNGNIITVRDLNDYASIGVTMSGSGVFTVGANIANDTVANTFFFSDINGYSVVATEDLQAKLIPIQKESTPNATFTATGADTGTLTNVTAGMKYRIADGSWTDITSGADIGLTGLSAGTIQVVRKGNGTTTADSDPQTITVNKAETPNLTVTHPSVIGGKGTVATTTAHEYSRDGGSSWTACSSNQEFEAGTYMIRVKASGTVLASGHQSVTIRAFISVTVTFIVVNGSWNEGEGEDATNARIVILTGHEGDTLKLTAEQIPAVGNKPSETYKAGSWNVTPGTGTSITETTTYTYTYEQKETAVVNRAPAARTLSYTGSDQKLVTAGEAEGGEMQYVLGNDATTVPTTGYTASIPSKSNAGTYYVWYKVKGDADHRDTKPKCVTVTIERGNPATTYELRYDPGDGGTGSTETVTVTEGQVYTFPECTFDASVGKAFDHWIMSGVDGLFKPGSTVRIAGNCAVNGTITVTAHWKDAPQAAVETAPQAKNLIFNGSAQELVTEGKAQNGTMQYALGKDGDTAPEKGWDTAIPTGTSVGIYYVWYRVKGDKHYKDTEGEKVRTEIGRADHGDIEVSYEVSYGRSKTIDLTEHIEDGGKLKPGDPSVTDTENIIKAASGIDDGKLSIEINNDENLAGKNAKLAVSVEGAYNYKDYDIVVTVTVVKKYTQKLSFKEDSVTLKAGESYTNILSGAETSVSYKSSDDSIAAVDNSGKVTAKAKGKATITAEASETEDYLGAEKAYTVNVEDDIPEPTPPGPTPSEPVPEETVSYKSLDTGENLTVNGLSLNMRLYGPLNKVSYNGMNHVAAGTELSEKQKKKEIPDLIIGVDGVPGFAKADFVYGKTKNASSGKAWFAAKLMADKSSASYNALSSEEKKKLDKDIKKVNKTLKDKKNRVYFTIDKLDLGEFSLDTGSAAGGSKVFIRRDGSGDFLALKKKTKKHIDPETYMIITTTRTVLKASLSGNRITIPKKEYKKTGSGREVMITGKNKNLTGTTGK